MGRKGVRCIGGAGVQVGQGCLRSTRVSPEQDLLGGTVGLRWVPFEKLGIPEGSGLGTPPAELA